LFEIVHNVEIFEKFFKKELFTKKINIDWKIYQFFNNKHRAEILRGLEFSTVFVKDFIKRMKEFRDKNSLNDGGQINSVTNLNEMLNYVSLVKLNYIKYYDLVMSKYFIK
jgi:hypothetical protein